MAPRHASLKATLQPLLFTSRFTSKRSLHARVQPHPIPPPTPFCPDPATFLTLIGRQLSQHSSKIPSWNALFSLTSQQLRDLGVEPARSRRYLLHWRDKFRRGQFGMGGDLQHVVDGKAEVRLVDVKFGSEIERKAWEAKHGKGKSGDDLARLRAEGKIQAPTGSLTRTPGMRTVVLNVPADARLSPSTAASEGSEETTSKEEVQDPQKTTAEGQAKRKLPLPPLTKEQLAACAPVMGVKVKPMMGLYGSHVRLVKSTQGTVATIQASEGMWEEKRGHKVDGGERRKAEVRAKRRAAERKAERR